MKKFNVNITGNFNIYGEVIPINAFYGKIGDVIYYYCKKKVPPTQKWEGGTAIRRVVRCQVLRLHMSSLL